jgi:twitching motility protein PilT
LVQKLLKGAKKEVPVVPAMEIMFVNPTIKKLIRDGEDNKISDAIQAFHEEGMQTMNQALGDLVRAGMLAEKVALENSPNPEQLSMNLKGIKLGAEDSIIG